MTIKASGGTVIRITDMGIYAERLKTLQREIPRLMRDSLEDALTNGDSGILAEIWRRTPQSDRARYAFRLASSLQLGDWKKDGSALKSGWRKKVETSDGKALLDRIDQYGQQRLRKAVFGGQDSFGIRGLRTEVSDTKAGFSIVVEDVPYARMIHEATYITGYWSGDSVRGIGDKYGGGWSTPGTTARFLTAPVAEKRDNIRTDVRNALAYRLEELMG